MYFSPDGQATSVLRQFGPGWMSDIVQSPSPYHKTIISKASDIFNPAPRGTANVTVYFADPERDPLTDPLPRNCLVPVCADGQIAVVCSVLPSETGIEEFVDWDRWFSEADVRELLRAYNLWWAIELSHVKNIENNALLMSVFLPQMDLDQALAEFGSIRDRLYEKLPY